MAELSRRALLGAAPLLLAAPALARATEAGGHAFRFDSIEGGVIDLGEWRGKPVLVVNTASFCGFAPQFSGLQALHEQYGPRGLLVLGVPSNDFNQEQSDSNSIKDFCEATFGVAFPLAMPAHVKGPRAHPFFAWAATQGSEPRWNFFKYLVGRDGRLAHWFPSRVAPDSAEFRRALEAALA
ncbi:glutathione peroxidase [Pseudoroseomonas cervicalis]|uniref:Glutathione peroxidase n=1 Tax=Pseudoroseomonas cervicalis ATCC 49957 TaxID=525371 RepID=D5RR79_9PROT|nr:glutathione peroxidase [Pseudoroseomonas cervicalis]EFH10185.1 glutathione peroxidase [Pseudoroseomonas cervicalis ATCC 49957]